LRKHRQNKRTNNSKTHHTIKEQQTNGRKQQGYDEKLREHKLRTATERNRLHCEQKRNTQQVEKQEELLEQHELTTLKETQNNTPTEQKNKTAQWTSKSHGDTRRSRNNNAAKHTKQEKERNRNQKRRT
jgi:hypothetical protein